MKIILIHNSTAGDKEYSADHLCQLLRKAGYDTRVMTLTDAKADPRVLQEAKFVAVAGGDGSIRQMAVELVGTDALLAPIPLGTANNIARSLGISGNPEAVIAGWSAGERRKIDMGRAKGSWGTHLFLEGAGVGLIGRAIAVIDEIDAADPREFAGREDKLRRDLSVLVAMTHDLPAVPLNFATEGREEFGDYLVFEIMNIAGAGPRVNLAAGTDSSDGYFDLVVARAEDRKSLLKSLHSCLGVPEHPPLLSSVKVRQLNLKLLGGEFRVDDTVVLRRDEPHPAENLIEIEMVPGALNVLIPKKG